MRPYALALACVLAACSSSDPISPRDCTPGATSVCACPGGAAGVQTCAAGGTLGACACGGDAGADVLDASSPTDAPALEDRSAPMDAAVGPDVVQGPDVVDAGAPDVVAAPDVVDAGRCPNGVAAVCEGRSVSLQSGVREGDRTLHCGACGNACAPGTFCVQCVCER